MRSQDRALELLEQIVEHLTDADLAGKTVATLDYSQIPNALSSGDQVVTILTPKRRWPTEALEEFEWTVLLIAGPINDEWTAWARLDDLVEALRGPLIVDMAEPGEYAAANGPNYPAMTLTFTEVIN